MRRGLCVLQKLKSLPSNTDIQVGDWKPPASAPSHLLTREFSYIKPLSAPVGPKSAKCVVVESSEIVDFDSLIVVLTVTRTPDVPSGGSFSVKTRTCITWARHNSCRVQVFTTVDWIKSSFLKGELADNVANQADSLQASSRPRRLKGRNHIIKSSQPR